MTKELVVSCSCSKRGSQRAPDEILDRIASSNESTTGKNNMNTARNPRPSFEHATADCSSPCPLFPLSHGARAQNGRRYYYPPSLQSPDILSNFYRNLARNSRYTVRPSVLLSSAAARLAALWVVERVTRVPTSRTVLTPSKR